VTKEDIEKLIEGTYPFNLKKKPFKHPLLMNKDESDLSNLTTKYRCSTGTRKKPSGRDSCRLQSSVVSEPSGNF